MKDIFEGGRSDLIFYYYYDSICKFKYFEIGPKCTIFKKIFCSLQKMTMTKKNEERKYNGLKEKIFTNKMVLQFLKYLD